MIFSNLVQTPVKYSGQVKNTELTAALRFSLPLCLAGCRRRLLHFVFVLLLFLITSRILKQEGVHLN